MVEYFIYCEYANLTDTEYVVHGLNFVLFCQQNYQVASCQSNMAQRLSLQNYITIIIIKIILSTYN